MKSVLILLSMFCIISAQEIGDFAPFISGSQWIYSYKSITRSAGSPYMYSDSLTVTISLVNKETSGADTAIYLQITQDGLHHDSGFSHINTISDSIISESFIDTVYIQNGEIKRSINYRSKVFPFCINHNVSVDNLQIGTSNNADVYYYVDLTDRSEVSGYSTYVQNIGLSDDKYGGYHKMTDYSSQTRLISYNKISFSLGAQAVIPRIKSLKERSVTFTILQHPRELSLIQAYDLKGRVVINCNKKFLPVFLRNK